MYQIDKCIVGKKHQRQHFTKGLIRSTIRTTYTSVSLLSILHSLPFIETLTMAPAEPKFIPLRISLVCPLVGPTMGDIYNSMKYIIGVTYTSIWLFLLRNNSLDTNYGLKLVYSLLEMRIYQY